MTAGGPREIQLTKGHVALVDAADFEWLNQRPWRAVNGYAARNVRKSGAKTTLYMHRLIMAPAAGAWVDHVNGDRSDNRRANLRFADRAENARNAGPKSNNRSGFKGVRLINAPRLTSQRWVAHIGVDSQAIYLGVYETAEQAARAYDVAALKHHGEFARLNFPEAA